MPPLSPLPPVIKWRSMSPSRRSRRYLPRPASAPWVEVGAYPQPPYPPASAHPAAAPPRLRLEWTMSCSWGPDAGALPVVARVVSRCPSPPGRVKGVKHLAVYPWWATRLGTPPLPPSTARMGGFVCYIRSLSPQFTSSAQRAGCVKAGGQVDALSTLHPTGPGPRPSPSLDLTRGGIDSQRRAFAKYWTASL